MGAGVTVGRSFAHTVSLMPERPERKPEDRLVWIDLEMTGLDVERHVIVEIACLVTDSELELVDDGIDIVVHQDAEAMSAMDDFVRKMHTKSGLLPQIEASTVDLATAGARVLEYVKGHVPDTGQAPLCGNSIGVDRRFLDRGLPELDQYLHYRSIDVSSLKELCRRWYPEIYRGRPSKKETHRALDDIRESVAELRYYRETMLKPAEAAP
jgi:oligoribonuclease